MTDDEIRGLVRLAIQKHLGPGASPDRRGGPSTFAPGATVDRSDPPAGPPPLLSIAFGRYPLPRADDDTMCIIEPEVKCNHCGYCQCHGH